MVDSLFEVYTHGVPSWTKPLTLLSLGAAFVSLDADAGEWWSDAWVLARVDATSISCDEESQRCKLEATVERALAGFAGDQHGTKPRFEIHTYPDTVYVDAKGRRRPAATLLAELANGAPIVATGRHLADERFEASGIRRAFEQPYSIPAGLEACAPPPWSADELEACREKVGDRTPITIWSSGIAGKTRCRRGAVTPCIIEAERDGREEPVLFPKGAKLRDPSGKIKGPGQLLPGTRATLRGHFELPTPNAASDAAWCGRDRCWPTFIVAELDVL